MDAGGDLPPRRGARGHPDPTVVGEGQERSLHGALVVIEQTGEGSDADRLMLRDSLEHREHAGPAADAFDAHRATKRTGRVIGPFDQSTGFLGAAQPGGKLVVATRSLVPWRRRPAERQVVAGGGTRPVDAECVPPP